MKRLTLISALLVGLFAAAGAQAQTQPTFGVAADAGSTGLGLYGVLPVNSSFNARLGAHFGDYTYNGSKSNVDFAVKLKAHMFDVLLDYYPVADSAFRISGGLVYNQNKVTFNTKSGGTGTYTLNGTTYNIANVGEVNGGASFPKVAPYLGIGYGNALKTAGFSFTSDVGVMFQGSADTHMANVGCSASVTICTQLASDLATENNAFRDRVNDYKMLPVVRVGVSYRF